MIRSAAAPSGPARLARCALLVVLGLASILPGAAQAARTGAGIAPGIWAGTLSLNPTPSNPRGQAFQTRLTIDLLGSDRGALADLPEETLYGYPLEEVKWSPSRISFELGAFGEGEELAFSGMYAGTSRDGRAAILGSVAGRSWRGTFMVSAEPAAVSPGESDLEFGVEGGSLPGTLLLPPGASGSDQALPLVVLLSGAGAADRNGNNFNVPGRTDSLAALARMLADRGIASFRYDKRGTGKAYRMADSESAIPYGTHIRDAAAALRALRGIPRWSRILLAGMNEGAWIGAAALNGLAGAEAFADGLAVLAASGKSPMVRVRETIDALDPALAPQAEALLEAIMRGDEIGTVPAPLAGLFDLTIKERLSSWFGFDPSRELALVQAPLLLVFGQADLQAPASEFDLLLEARPGAAAFVIAGMNHALKRVGDDEEANFASFSDPMYPVPEELADLLASFALVRPPPATLPRYRRPAPR